MTKEQFLNAIGDIDDKFVKIMYDAPDESQEIDPNDEKPQVVKLTNKHISF